MNHQTHFTYFMTYPWFLLAVLCIWLSVEKRRWSASVGAVHCIGIMALIGAVHLLLILGVLFAAFGAWHTALAIVSTWRRRQPAFEILRPALSLLLAGVLGMGIGAVRIAPAIALIGRSARQKIDWESINAAVAPAPERPPARHPMVLRQCAPGLLGRVQLPGHGPLSGHPRPGCGGRRVLDAWPRPAPLVSGHRRRHGFFGGRGQVPAGLQDALRHTSRVLTTAKPWPNFLAHGHCPGDAGRSGSAGDLGRERRNTR